MKKLFRVIFYIPKLLLQFIWNLIWAIFKLALVLALIGYGLVYYANNSSSTLATNINQAFHQVELGFSGTSTSDVEKVVSNLSTTDTIPESNGARWAQNTASIYIQSTDETSESKEYWQGVFGDLEGKDIEQHKLVNLAKQHDKKTKFFAWCGLEDFLFESQDKAVADLKALGLDIDYHTDHGRHEWYYWEKQLEAYLEWLPIDYVKEERLS